MRTARNYKSNPIYNDIEKIPCSKFNILHAIPKELRNRNTMNLEPF